MAEITHASNIVKKYGDGFPAVNDVSLDVADGEFMILVGPSGCGKSTLLRMIVGLEDITSGDMLIGGERVNDKAPRDRNLAMVFQNYALYPHLTRVREHRLPAAAARRAVRRRDQGQGRGGGRRRSSSPSTSSASRPTSPAASASGWRWAAPSCARPTRSCSTSRCPTSTPSCAARCAPRSCGMQRRLGITTVYVTHDQTEAMTLGDRVAVLRKGVLQQVATPARALRASRQPVRRGLHRLAADELRARPVDGGQLKPAVRRRRAARRSMRAAVGGPRLRDGRHPAGALRGRRAGRRRRRRRAASTFAVRGRRHRVAGQRAVRLHPLRCAGRRRPAERAGARAGQRADAHPARGRARPAAAARSRAPSSSCGSIPRRMHLFDPESGKALATGQRSATPRYGDCDVEHQQVADGHPSRADPAARP